MRKIGVWGPGILAGALVTLAVMYHWIGWSLLPGGGCGDGIPCPHGSTPLLLLAFLFTFTGVGALALAFALTGRATVGETAVQDAVPGTRPGSRLLLRGAVPVVLGAALVVLPGLRFADWLRGPQPLHTGWTAAADRPSTVRAVAVWSSGAAVVRVRQDGLRAFRAADGGELWSQDAPARASVCAASPQAVDGLAVVGYSRNGAPCATVGAVDLLTGRQLWTLDGLDASADPGGDAVALSPELALLREQSRIRAVGAHDGRERWRHQAGAGCTESAVTASATRLVALEFCVGGDGPLTGRSTLVGLSPANGAVLWHGDLPTESSAEIGFLSTDPLVLDVQERDDRGVHAVLSFDGQGKPLATIATSQQDGDLALSNTGTLGFAAAPVRLAAVADGTLVTTATPSRQGLSTTLTAFSLTDGHRLWSDALGARVTALTPPGDGSRTVTAVLEGESWTGEDIVQRFDAADGRSLARTVYDGVPRGQADWLGRFGDRYVLVSSDGTGDRAPLLGLPAPGAAG